MCFLVFFILVLVVLLVLRDDLAECLVRLPLLDLAVPRTVPLVLALGAPLRRHFPAIRALRVLHELFKHVRVVQFHYAVHVLLQRLLVLIEELPHLVVSNVLPVAVLHDLCSQLRDGLHNEAILLGDCVILGHGKFLERTQ